MNKLLGPCRKFVLARQCTVLVAATMAGTYVSHRVRRKRVRLRALEPWFAPHGAMFTGCTLVDWSTIVLARLALSSVMRVLLASRACCTPLLVKGDLLAIRSLRRATLPRWSCAAPCPHDSSGDPDTRCV